MLLIMFFEKKAKATMIGTTEIAIPKYIAPRFIATGEPFKAPIITGKVNLLGVRNMINGVI